MPHPRTHHFRRAPQGRAQVLPMIHRRPLHLPTVPAPPYQPRRSLCIRLLARVAQMPLYPYRLPSPKAPRMTCVPSILDRHPTTAMRALPPVPNAACGQLAQSLGKCSPTLYNVHDACFLGDFSRALDCRHPSFCASPELPPLYQHKPEPSRESEKRNAGIVAWERRGSDAISLS